MRSTVSAMRSELKETIQREMKAVIQPILAELDEKIARNGATETARSGNDAVQRGVSGDPQGRRRSNAGRRTEKAV
jgi:hypothetical protein